MGSVGAAWKVSANWSQETMTRCSPNNYCFSIVQGQGIAPLVTSLPSSCYMINHVGAQNPHLPSLVLFIWKLEPRRMAGIGGWGGGGKRGIGYLWPYSGNSDCYKTNRQQCSHASWKKLMKLYRTSGIFNEYPLKNPEHCVFKFIRSDGFKGDPIFS